MKTLQGRFYFYAFLLFLLVGILAVQFLHFDRLINTNLSRSQHNQRIARSIRDMQTAFWKIRFWEKEILIKGRTDAEQEFAEGLAEFRRQLSSIQSAETPASFDQDFQKLGKMLFRYESSFNKLIQLQTQRRLKVTNLNSQHEIIASSLSMSGQSQILKPLITLSRFHSSYFVERDPSEFQAIRLVVQSIARDLAQIPLLESRLAPYLDTYQELLGDIEVMNERRNSILETFSSITRDLNAKVASISQRALLRSDDLARETLDLTATLRRSIILSLVASVLILVLVLRGVARRIVAPIQSISGVVHAVQTGNLEARYERNGEDEISQFGRTVNAMLDTVQQKTETERLQLRAVIDQAAEGMLIADKTETVRYVNPAVSRISGYPSQHILGKMLPDVFRDTFRSSASDDICNSLRQRQPWAGETENLSAEDTEFLADVRVSPIRTDRGELSHISVVIRDTTRENQVDQQLRQAQKMQAMGTLAGGIAHDFNNILGAILGNTEIALMEEPENEEVRHSLDEVLQASRRARELVRQILTFSRQSEHEPKVVQPAPILKEVLKLLRATLPTTIEIHHDIRAADATVIADATQIHQLLMNLATNAAHAMQDKGGILSVTFGSTELRRENVPQPDMLPGSYVCLQVSDTGQGMNKAMVERIFEPYFTTKEKEKGTGLGLALVHGIVTQHGGAVTVDTAPGRGSRFSVYLPKAPRGDGAAGVKPGTGAELPRGTEHILFVDDEESLTRLTSQMLRKLGYRVTATTVSTQALEMVRESPDHFDLVITDQTMPELTGEALARELLAIKPDLPVIICTGYSNVMTAEKAASMGIRAFLMKPIVIHQLADVVRKALSRSPSSAAYADATSRDNPGSDQC